MTTNADRLADCPFCGCAARVNRSISNKFEPVCTDILCFGFLRSSNAEGFDTAQEAVGAWNKRSAQSGEVEGKQRQLSASVDNDLLKISIGVNILAWAVQCNDGVWPDDHYIPNPEAFAKRVAEYLLIESEDGATEIHRALDRASIDLFEMGEEEISEGDVQLGIEILKGQKS